MGIILVRGEFKRGFVKTDISKAVGLQECPHRELRLYLKYRNLRRETVNFLCSRFRHLNSHMPNLI